MTIKKPKGLFLSILNKFCTPYLIVAKYTASLKKLTAYHFLEGAKPVARSMAQGAEYKSQAENSVREFLKSLTRLLSLNTCGLLHIVLSVFYWKLFIFLNLLPEFPYKSFIFTAILKITQYETISIDD